MEETNVNFVEEGARFIDSFKKLEGVIREKCELIGIETERANTSDLIRELSKKNSVVRRYKDELMIIKDTYKIVQGE